MASLQRSHSSLKNADRRGGRCAVATNAVYTLCNRLDCQAAAFVLSMLKIKAAAWRLHSVLNSALWECCGNTVGSSRAPILERHGRIVGGPRAPILHLEWAFAMHFDNNTNNHKMY